MQQRSTQKRVMRKITLLVVFVLMCETTWASGNTQEYECATKDQSGVQHVLKIKLDSKRLIEYVAYRTMTPKGIDCVIEASRQGSINGWESSVWEKVENTIKIKLMADGQEMAMFDIRQNGNSYRLVVKEVRPEAVCGLNGYLGTSINLDVLSKDCVVDK